MRCRSSSGRFVACRRGSRVAGLGVVRSPHNKGQIDFEKIGGGITVQVMDTTGRYGAGPQLLAKIGHYSGGASGTWLKASSIGDREQRQGEVQYEQAALMADLMHLAQRFERDAENILYRHGYRPER